MKIKIVTVSKDSSFKLSNDSLESTKDIADVSIEYVANNSRALPIV